MSWNRNRKHVITDDPAKYAHTGISLRKWEAPVAPKSWWLEHPTREGFTARATQEIPRMQLSKFADTSHAMAS